MAVRYLHKTETQQEEVIRALLANGGAVMKLASQLDLKPREVRSILQELLMQLDELPSQANDCIPITAQLPENMSRRASDAIQSLFAREIKSQ